MTRKELKKMVDAIKASFNPSRSESRGLISASLASKLELLADSGV
jgi:hypothetical protein